MRNRLFLYIFAVSCLLFLPGCRSPLDVQNKPVPPKPEPLLLTINRPAPARTILPSWPESVEFRLDFFALTAGNENFSIDSSSNDITVYLDAGSWNLEVTASFPSTETEPRRAVARSEVHYVATPATETLYIELFPIVEGDAPGWFEWDISFYPVPVTAARMEIRDWHSNAPLTPPRTYYLVGGTSALGTSSRIDLPAGQYRVFFTATSINGEEVAESIALHVSRNLVSRFYGEKAIFVFPVSLLNFILGTWDSGSSSWNFEAGITAAHFYALGISGVNSGNFGEVVQWLNRLTSYFGAPAGLHGLTALVNAALVGIEEQAVPVLRDNLADKFAWLRGNATDSTRYIIALSNDTDISPVQARLPANRSDLTIVLRNSGAMHTINLSEIGNLFVVSSGVTLVLDGNITLQGRYDNITQLVNVNTGGTLVMGTGSVIRGNTNTSGFGGGVLVNGTFIMNGGKISDNAALYGGGVYSSQGTFRIGGGIIHGIDEPAGNTGNGAAMFGMAQYGTLNDAGEFILMGTLTTVNFTIEVASGELIRPALTVTFACGEHATLPPPAGAIPGGEIELPVLSYLNRNSRWFAMRGWSTNPNAAVPEFPPGGVFIVGSDHVTLHAIWSTYGFGFYDGTVTSFSGGSTEIVIPPTIKGMPVTAIGNGAFTDSRLTSVVMPDSITYIGASAFASSGMFASEWNRLESIVIPGNVAYIGSQAFANNQLTSVVIPGSVTSIGSSAFWNNQLTSVVISNGVTSIGSSAFESNQLTSAVIPGSVTFIESSAFANNQLASVVISGSVTSIGSSAFWNNQLASVVISNGVTSIGSSAFESNQLTSVVIPDSVTFIGWSAFANNQLTSVVIPSSITYIEGSVFFNNQLTEVDIPDSVAFIGWSAFANNRLREVDIPLNVTFIGASAFANNRLTSVIIPANVTFIESAAFENNWLISVVIPAGVTFIGERAFANNWLTSVAIPTYVTFIGERAFANNRLQEVVIPASVISIEIGVFENNRLISVTIPAGVTYIQDSAFAGNMLSSVAIPASITYIGDLAFVNNVLSSVAIPAGVTYIGDLAFANNMLSSVVIPAGITHISWGAFAGNTLTTVTIPGGVNIENNTAMGVHGVSFLALYNGNGRLAGIYTFASGNWIRSN